MKKQLNYVFVKQKKARQRSSQTKKQKKTLKRKRCRMQITVARGDRKQPQPQKGRRLSPKCLQELSDLWILTCSIWFSAVTSKDSTPKEVTRRSTSNESSRTEDNSNKKRKADDTTTWWVLKMDVFVFLLRFLLFSGTKRIWCPYENCWKTNQSQTFYPYFQSKKCK